MNFHNAVYNAASTGQLKRLKWFFEQRSKDEIGQLVNAKTNGATPLVMACRHGHYDVAEYLIEKCGADIEEPGSVVFDGEIIEGAPPLWCAAAAGHFNLVKLLVSRGAKVNSITKTNSTPLRAACFDGHFDIVKYLVQHGADIEIPNRHGHTCLMIVCYRGHYDLAMFLLTLNADANRKSIKGNTALHDCAESGSLDILKVLVAHRAKMDADSFGMTPLLAAAVTGHTDIVDYLIETPDLVTRQERIDALELLGTTYVDKKKDMIGGLECWKRAMEERYRGDGPVIPKPHPPPLVAAYDFTREITDPDALDDLLADPDEMRMQALVIRERILGPAHPDTSYYIRYRGAMYADSGKFTRGIDLWNYALDMQQSILEPLNLMTISSLFGFIELFGFMIGEEGRPTSRGRRVPPVEIEQLLRVFRKAVMELKLGKLMLDKIPTSERDLTNLNKVLVITLHFACLLTHKIPEEGTQQYIELHKALHELIRINARGKQNRDALQLIQTEDVALVSRYPACKFPSLTLTKAFLEAGADVSVRDDEGHTALHLTALAHVPRPDLSIALLEAGAHLDETNKFGTTFETLMRDRGLYASINPMKYTTLTCLAARVVSSTYPISCVPKHLQAFVQMHRGNL